MDKSGLVAIVVALIGTAGVLGSKYIEVGGKTAPKVEAVTTATASAPTAPGIDGNWHDQFGGDFVLSADNAAVVLTGHAGKKKMTGTGSLAGAAIKVQIANTLDDGITHCAGLVVSARLIAADCTDADGSNYGWRLER